MFDPLGMGKKDINSMVRPNPKPQFPNSTSQTLNPKPYTPNLTPHAPKSKLHTLHPKPKPLTINPKPQTTGA